MSGSSRPRMRAIRPFTTGVVNPLTRRFVHFLPFFAIIGYRGRTSGKRYRTPMNVFRHGDDYIFALTYGSDVDWVRNVLAAGRADLQIGRRHIALTEPKLITDPKRRLVPLPVRLILGLLRVDEFLRMRRAQTSPSPG